MKSYQDLAEIDILTPIRDKYKISFNKHGQPKVFLDPQLSYDSMWINSGHRPDRACNLWRAYFNNYGIISRGCRSCFKVVMEIATLKELIDIMQYQQSGKYMAKCGPEQRPFTGKIGKYGGYWYAPMKDGLAGARAMWKEINADFPDAGVLLKRGCTEFEMTYSPSDSWDRIAEERDWDFKEELLGSLFETNPLTLWLEANRPLVHKLFVIRKWIEWAFEHGDKTYLEFTKFPFKQDYLTYHNSIHRNDDFVCSNYHKIQEGVKYANIGSAEAAGVGDNQLGGSSDEDSGESSRGKDSIIHGLPDD